MFNFECIKIDKDYFWEIQSESEFFKRINKIKSYCNFVIVEGVETIEQKIKYILLLIALAREGCG
ncbi:hypothetical protein A79E_3047 [Klebsiella pneumoniae subsp. pneumoniae 1084]|nr:hypothetical protein A79E_3047 [Klebsiella pneumoniae subsp. pneumoniae 1084]